MSPRRLAQLDVEVEFSTTAAAKDKAEQLKAQAIQQAEKAADATAKATSRAAFGGFVALLLGAIAAAFGGYVGRPRGLVNVR